MTDRDEWEQRQMDARERGEWLDEQLRDAYDEGSKDERESLTEPIHASVVFKVKRAADADDLDIVGFAWRLQREWLDS